MQAARLVVPRPRRRHRHVAVRVVGVVREDRQRLLPPHLRVVPQVRHELDVRERHLSRVRVRVRVRVGLGLGSGLDVRGRHQPGDGTQHIGDELQPVVRVGLVVEKQVREWVARGTFLLTC